MKRTIRDRASTAAALAVAVIAAVAQGASAQSRIPTPESVFGFRVGADSQLFGYDQSIAYFRRLAAASPRIKLIEVGKTSTGHAWTCERSGPLSFNPARLWQPAHEVA